MPFLASLCRHELLDQTRATLDKRWVQIGFDALPRVERDFVVLWGMIAEVNSGSFHQYFFNSGGDTALEAHAACEQLGALATRQILADALAVFDAVGGYTPERFVRQDRMELLADEFTAFRSCTDAFHACSEEVLELALIAVHHFYLSAGLMSPHV